MWGTNENKYFVKTFRGTIFIGEFSEKVEISFFVTSFGVNIPSYVICVIYRAVAV